MQSRTTAYSSSRRAMRSDLRLAGRPLASAGCAGWPWPARAGYGLVESMRESPELSGGAALAGFLPVFQLNSDIGSRLPRETHSLVNKIAADGSVAIARE